MRWLRQLPLVEHLAITLAPDLQQIFDKNLSILLILHFLRVGKVVLLGLELRVPDLEEHWADRLLRRYVVIVNDVVELAQIDCLLHGLHVLVRLYQALMK